MSWAEGADRLKHKSPPGKEQIEEKIRLIENTLSYFAQDNDLHDDLKLPIVQVGVDRIAGLISDQLRWRGRPRLSILSCPQFLLRGLPPLDGTFESKLAILPLVK